MALPQPAHRRMVTRLKPGEMRVYFPGTTTPEDADPFIGGRSSDGQLRCLAYLHLSKAGALVTKELEVMSWDGTERHIGANEVRNLPLHRWLTRAHTALAGWEAAERGQGRGTRLSITDWTAGTERGRGRGFYRRTAFGYLELQDLGVTHIQKRLAEESGERLGIPLDAVQIRDALTKATRLGFLTPGIRGRAGRRPGPNLYVDFNEGKRD
jgi:hypothetical protein